MCSTKLGPAEMESGTKPQACTGRISQTSVQSKPVYSLLKYCTCNN